jgi:hypothetical protein
MTSRKKPGVAFWATVVLVAVLVLYPLSFGPACWLAYRDYMSDDVRHIATVAYSPIAWISENGPKPLQDAIASYASLWL